MSFKNTKPFLDPLSTFQKHIEFVVGRLWKITTHPFRLTHQVKEILGQVNSSMGYSQWGPSPLNPNPTSTIHHPPSKMTSSLTSLHHFSFSPIRVWLLISLVYVKPWSGWHVTLPFTLWFVVSQFINKIWAKETHHAWATKMRLKPT